MGLPYKTEYLEQIKRRNAFFILTEDITTTIPDTIVGGSGTDDGEFLALYASEDSYDYALGKLKFRHAGLYSISFHFQYVASNLLVKLIKNGVVYCIWEYPTTTQETANCTTTLIINSNDEIYLTVTGTGEGVNTFDIRSSAVLPYESWGTVTLLE